MKKVALVIISVLDFLFGIVVGILGHFFGLFIFPILASIRGVLTVLIHNKNTEFDFKKNLMSSILGSVLYYVGLIIGGAILLFIVVPNSEALQEAMGGALSTPEGKLGGALGVLVCGIIYILIYNLCSIAAGLITHKLVYKPALVEKTE